MLLQAHFELDALAAALEERGVRGDAVDPGASVRAMPRATRKTREA